MESSLDRYKANLPHTVICSESKMIPVKAERFLPKRYALNKPYLVVNNPKRNWYFIVDVDRDDSLIWWDIAGLPCPTLIVVNKDTGRSHYYYELALPLPERSKWSEKTNRLIEAVIRYYCYALQSHKAIIDQIQLSKNAVCGQWETFGADDNCGLYSMSELAEYNKPLPKITKITEDDKDSRNCYLFNQGRKFAYSIVKDCNSEIEFNNRLEAHLLHLNAVVIPSEFPDKGSLEYGEVKSIRKSISCWVWTKRSNFQLVKSVGVMGFNPIDETWLKEDSLTEIKKRQRLSADYTHQVRKEKTTNAIQSGVKSCRDRGMEITVKNVAELSGVNVRSVYRYINLLK
jgi:hypothetical protein